MTHASLLFSAVRRKGSAMISWSNSSLNATSRLGAQPKRWVPISDQEDRVGSDPAIPTDDALHELEYPPRIVPGEQDGEPGDNHHHDHGNVQEEQHHVVGDGQEPLH